MGAREETNNGEERREGQRRKRNKQHISQRAPDKVFDVMELAIPPTLPLTFTAPLFLFLLPCSLSILIFGGKPNPHIYKQKDMSNPFLLKS